MKENKREWVFFSEHSVWWGLLIAITTTVPLPMFAVQVWNLIYWKEKCKTCKNSIKKFSTHFQASYIIPTTTGDTTTRATRGKDLLETDVNSDNVLRRRGLHLRTSSSLAPWSVHSRRRFVISRWNSTQHIIIIRLRTGVLSTFPIVVSNLANEKNCSFCPYSPWYDFSSTKLGPWLLTMLLCECLET